METHCYTNFTAADSAFVCICICSCFFPLRVIYLADIGFANKQFGQIIILFSLPLERKTWQTYLNMARLIFSQTSAILAFVLKPAHINKLGCMSKQISRFVLQGQCHKTHHGLILTQTMTPNPTQEHKA